MGKRVDFLVKDKFAILTLNAPEKRNAIDNFAVEELTSYFKKADSDKNIRAIVFGGRGPSFSSGADLDYLLNFTEFARRKS